MDWTDIPGFEGFYQAHPDGRLRSCNRTMTVVRADARTYQLSFQGKLLRPSNSSTGYPQVTLWKQHKATQGPVHKFIMLTFVGPRPAGCEIRHLDGNKKNPELSNLAYGTPLQNASDKLIHGTHIQGENIPWSVLTESDVLFIRNAKGSVLQADLARQFGIVQSQVSRIQNYHQWTHVK